MLRWEHVVNKFIRPKAEQAEVLRVCEVGNVQNLSYSRDFVPRNWSSGISIGNNDLQGMDTPWIFAEFYEFLRNKVESESSFSFLKNIYETESKVKPKKQNKTSKSYDSVHSSLNFRFQQNDADKIV